MAKQETGLSSEKANLMRVLNSSALSVFTRPNVPTLFCSKWWELEISHTLQIKHKDKQLSLNNSNPVSIKSLQSRELKVPLSQWTYSKHYLKGIWAIYKISGKPSSLWYKLGLPKEEFSVSQTLLTVRLIWEGCLNNSHSQSLLQRFWLGKKASNK